ncbi:glycosyltransferase [uncultured Fusobacterium sp.]|jgi:glycosyltransferase involved in cell wall biosynthesis|uniref:glycosyltransferase n=1 Tax=uncultured Fusobacterium sp. TaxID=159267 RepID=UPI0025EAF974|nr:glycosyltransferase [uncultured Fusobacterium sp.]
MRIIQILNTFSYGDAIGNHALTIHRELIKRNIDSKIYARVIDARVREYADLYENYIEQKDDTILYHLSSGNDLNKEILKHRCKIGLNYHNITPGEFFEEYCPDIQKNCNLGREDLKRFKDKVDFVIGVSDFNIQEIKELDFNCKLYTIPILINFNDYNQTSDSEVLKNLSDGKENILFVGRIAPNKCQEKLISDFYFYKKIYNPNSRLILVGNPDGIENYYLRLKRYVSKLKLQDVIFTGHLKFAEILSYYKKASLFVCESAHEGFCVPLVEAMYFNVPIIARDCGAIKETLGDGGIILKNYSPIETASVMNKLMNDEKVQNLMKENQNKRIEKFKTKYIMEQYLEALGCNGN